MHTRYTATARMNIDDRGGRTRYASRYTRYSPVGNPTN
jgi:hypothetical protein